MTTVCRASSLCSCISFYLRCMSEYVFVHSSVCMCLLEREEGLLEFDRWWYEGVNPPLSVSSKTPLTFTYVPSFVRPLVHGYMHTHAASAQPHTLDSLTASPLSVRYLFLSLSLPLLPSFVHSVASRVRPQILGEVGLSVGAVRLCPAIPLLLLPLPLLDGHNIEIASLSRLKQAADSERKARLGGWMGPS